MRRSNNQDSHSAVRATNVEMWRQRGHLFMVADGMGAHAVGELASKMACDNIPHYYNKTKAGTPAEAISKAFREVGALIHGRATANRDFQGMGTTCSSLLLLPQGALIAHVGDSRVYRVRRGRIDQLSFDHSLAWELIRRNHLSPEKRAPLGPQERHHPESGAGGHRRGGRRRPPGRRARRRVRALLRRPDGAGQRPRGRAPSPRISTPRTRAATWSRWPTCAADMTTSRSWSSASAPGSTPPRPARPPRRRRGRPRPITKGRRGGGGTA